MLRSAESVNMSSTLRLVYPQWQGGVISGLVPEIKDPNESSRGYSLGAELLHYLAPNPHQKTVKVPISMDTSSRKVVDGVMDRDVIYEQSKATLEILEKESPDRIVVLGGECSVSVVPFTFLANKYKDDVAMIWIDGHPDITLPGDPYPGFHAMAVTAIMGCGDSKITRELPAQLSPSKILLVGIRNWERHDIPKRQRQYGIKSVSPQDIALNSECIRTWLRACGASKVMIHLDLDVLDPKEIVAAVGTDPGGMKINEVIRVVQDIAAEKELVGLTIAEHMPRTLIRVKNILSQLPLLNNA